MPTVSVTSRRSAGAFYSSPCSTSRQPPVRTTLLLPCVRHRIRSGPGPLQRRWFERLENRPTSDDPDRQTRHTRRHHGIQGAEHEVPEEPRIPESIHARVVPGFATGLGGEMTNPGLPRRAASPWGTGWPVAPFAGRSRRLSPTAHRVMGNERTEYPMFTQRPRHRDAGRLTAPSPRPAAMGPHRLAGGPSGPGGLDGSRFRGGSDPEQRLGRVLPNQRSAVVRPRSRGCERIGSNLGSPGSKHLR